MNKQWEPRKEMLLEGDLLLSFAEAGRSSPGVPLALGWFA
jgi:hypothetical protein